MDLQALRKDAAVFGWVRTILLRIATRVFTVLRVELNSIRATPIDLERDCPSLPESIILRQLSEEDLHVAAADPVLGLNANDVSEAFARGDLAFGAYDGDELVSYVLRTTQTAPHSSEVSVRFRKPFSYLYKAFTRPSHRGLHIAPALFLFADKIFMDMGYTHRCAFINVCNLASMRAAIRMGSRFLGYAGFVRWFGRTRFFHTKAVREAGFEFFGSHTNRHDRDVR